MDRESAVEVLPYKRADTMANALARARSKFGRADSVVVWVFLLRAFSELEVHETSQEGIRVDGYNLFSQGPAYNDWRFTLLCYSIIFSVGICLVSLLFRGVAVE